jgi:hypothetical protein
VSDAAEPWVQHFAVTYSEDELWASGRFNTARHTGRDEAGTFLGLVFLAIPSVGLAAFTVFKLGLIELAALKPVLFTAYAAFAAGATSYWLAVRRQFRAVYRAFTRSSGIWHYTFDDRGISYKNDVRQGCVLWSAINSVKDLGWAVMFVAADQPVSLPSRVFSDSATRRAFVGASAARIKAAREPPKT